MKYILAVDRFDLGRLVISRATIRVRHVISIASLEGVRISHQMY